MKASDLTVDQIVGVSQVYVMRRNELGLFGTVRQIDAQGNRALIFFTKVQRELWVNCQRLFVPGATAGQAMCSAPVRQRAGVRDVRVGSKNVVSKGGNPSEGVGDELD